MVVKSFMVKANGAIFKMFKLPMTLALPKVSFVTENANFFIEINHR